MRHPLLRAGIIAAVASLAATAHAAPAAGVVARGPEVVRATDSTPTRAGSAPTWMTDALLGAFVHPAGAGASTPAPAGAASTDRPALSKPHQNPAFPAAFVFQSNSALVLAVDLAPSRGPATG